MQICEIRQNSAEMDIRALNFYNNRNKMGDSTAIQKVLKEYYKQLQVNKFNNLGEMDKSHEIHKTKSQPIKKNWNIFLTIKEIELEIKEFLKNVSPIPDTGDTRGENYIYRKAEELS